MAMLIRDQYNLLTLRCWLAYVADPAVGYSSDRQGSLRRVVRSQLFEGSMALDEPQATPVEQLGIVERMKFSRSMQHSIVGTPIEAQVRRAAQMAMVDSLWFHVPQDSFELALLPWEEMVWAVAPLPLLHIANFLEDPYVPNAQPRIVVCASQPLADGLYDVSNYVFALLVTIDQAAMLNGVRPRVSIFTDLAWHPHVEARLTGATLHQVTVEAIPKPVARPTSTRAEESPWLSWISEVSGDEPVDIVHFVSPGYFHERRGSLAVAAAPYDNQAPGQFIGATELVTLYDRLGCSVMAFSSPDMPMWEWGQRILGFELSWLRPGPILVMEHDLGNYPGLARYYALLFGAGRDALRGPGGPPAHLSCHPRLLRPSASDELVAKPRMPNDEAWQVRMNRRIEQTRARLVPTRELSAAEDLEARGARAALDYVEGLMSQTRDRGEEHMVATP